MKRGTTDVRIHLRLLLRNSDNLQAKHVRAYVKEAIKNHAHDLPDVIHLTDKLQRVSCKSVLVLHHL